MFQALKLAAAGAQALLCMSSAVLAEFVATPDFTKGDAAKGKAVYQRIGICVNCHGWAGDGGSGRNPMSHAAVANLRASGLDAQGLYDVIRCGVPGTQMPFHDSASYRDDRCHGLVMADFAGGAGPIKGRTFRETPMLDLIAYLQTYVVGLGKPTLEECVLYYEASAGKACAYLDGK